MPPDAPVMSAVWPEPGLPCAMSSPRHVAFPALPLTLAWRTSARTVARDSTGAASGRRSCGPEGARGVPAGTQWRAMTGRAAPFGYLTGDARDPRTTPAPGSLQLRPEASRLEDGRTPALVDAGPRHEVPTTCLPAKSSRATSRCPTGSASASSTRAARARPRASCRTTSRAARIAIGSRARPGTSTPRPGSRRSETRGPWPGARRRAGAPSRDPQGGLASTHCAGLRCGQSEASTRATTDAREARMARPPQERTEHSSPSEPSGTPSRDAPALAWSVHR